MSADFFFLGWAWPCGAWSTRTSSAAGRARVKSRRGAGRRVSLRDIGIYLLAWGRNGSGGDHISGVRDGIVRGIRQNPEKSFFRAQVAPGGAFLGWIREEDDNLSRTVAPVRGQPPGRGKTPTGGVRS